MITGQNYCSDQAVLIQSNPSQILRSASTLRTTHRSVWVATGCSRSFAMLEKSWNSPAHLKQTPITSCATPGCPRSRWLLAQTQVSWWCLSRAVSAGRWMWRLCRRFPGEWKELWRQVLVLISVHTCSVRTIQGKSLKSFISCFLKPYNTLRMKIIIYDKNKYSMYMSNWGPICHVSYSSLYAQSPEYFYY